MALGEDLVGGVCCIMRTVPKRSAAIYCRISRDPDGTSLGVNRQRADCEALVARKGWAVADLYVDDDVSAFTGRERPEYRRMLDDVKSGAADAVVAWHPDRLHRSPRDLEDFIDLIEGAGVAVATCTAGDYDLATPDGRLMARIVGSVARKESEDKSRRVRRKHLELAEAGMVSGGGVRPWGFERDRITVRPEEAALLRDAARRVLAGDSLYAIVGDWTAADVATSTGVPWSTTSLKSTLTRPRIAGLREHRGGIAGPAVWEAILDRATWERVRAVLTDPSRKRNPVVRAYLLTGLLRCGSCGKPMVATPRRRKLGGGARGVSVYEKGATQRAYGCVKAHDGCGSVYGLAEPIESYVTETVLDLLNTPRLAEAIAAREGGDGGAAEALAADEAKMLDLADDYDEGRIGKAEWQHLRAKIEARLGEARAQLGRRRPASVLADPAALAERWEALPLDRRRQVIAALLDHHNLAVTLGPAIGPRNRFDFGRVLFGPV